MVDIFQLLWLIRRPFRRARRFWKSLYYGVTNFLIIFAGAAVIVAIWYINFIL